MQCQAAKVRRDRATDPRFAGRAYRADLSIAVQIAKATQAPATPACAPGSHVAAFAVCATAKASETVAQDAYAAAVPAFACPAGSAVTLPFKTYAEGEVRTESANPADARAFM